MRFAWDERKRKSNFRDHGFDFRDAPETLRVVRVISIRKATRREETILFESLKD